MLLYVSIAFGGQIDASPTPITEGVDAVERTVERPNDTARTHSRSVRHVERKPDDDTRDSSRQPVAEVVTQTFEVTAYTAGHESTGKRPSDVGYGVTASGKHVQAGVTIACPPAMAFGTKLRIEGVGVRICHDRGGHIVEGRLDVYMPSLQDALDFGRQDVRVEVIGRR